MIVLGICDGQDCGAALIKDGKIIAAVNEERLSRIKLHESYYSGFPFRSIKAMLDYARPEEIDCIAVSSLVDPPLLLRYYSLFAKSRESAPVTKIDVRKKSIGWALKARVYDYYCKKTSDSFTGRFSASAFRFFLLKSLKRFGLSKKRVYFVDHHLAHAASAHFTSGLYENTCITLDGHGDGLSGTISFASGNTIKILDKLPASSSVGWFYAAITNYLGFKQHRHEGKITGLAAYGNYKTEYDKLKWCVGFDERENKIVNNMGSKFGSLFKVGKYLGRSARKEDVAATAQKLLEEVTLPYVKYAVKKTGNPNVTLSGGIFANVKLNQRINELKEVESVFIHPHMGDGGLAVGAALYVCAEEQKKAGIEIKPQRLKDAYFGNGYSSEEIENALKKENIEYEYHKKIEPAIAELLEKGKVVARFDGKMEYGPRALGNRSILYQATDPSVNDWLNKNLARSDFMPFAPVTLAGHEKESYINFEGGSYAAEFMTIAFDCTEKMKKECPAVVHVDNTARPQITKEDINKSYYNILKEYKKLTGLTSIVNTSFNIHEEPIVCSPNDAIRAFKIGHLGYLAIGNFLVEFK